MHALALVAVLVYAPPSGQAVDKRDVAEAALATALGGQPLVGVERVIDAARKAHSEGWVPEVQLAFFGAARKLALEGAQAVERVELERGAQLYARAEAIYETRLAWPGVASRMAETALLRGVALYELRRGDEARREWRRAAALDPAAQLTLAQVRPDVVRAFHEAVDAGVVPAEVPLLPRPGRDDLDALPEPLGAVALGETLGVDEVWAAAIAIDRGQPTVVARRLLAGGCATTTVTVSAASFDAAARGAVARLRAAEPRCPAAPESLLTAEAIAHPRPPSQRVVEPDRAAHSRPLRAYEQPWLWAAVVAGAALGVGLTVGLVPRSTQVRVNVSGGSFSLMSR